MNNQKMTKQTNKGEENPAGEKVTNVRIHHKKPD